MNTELLIQVRDRILAEPEHFDMDNWFDESPCGTTACIAGWTYALSTGFALANLRVFAKNTSHFAMLQLGLSIEEHVRLFWAFKWPEPFRSRYEAAKPKRRAQVAADRIDHFVRTEGRE